MGKKYRYMGLFLALIFMASQLVHIFHHHPASNHSTENSFKNFHYSKFKAHSSSVKKISISDHHCTACHYFAHHSLDSNIDFQNYVLAITCFLILLGFYFSRFPLKSQQYSCYQLRGPPAFSF